MRILIANPDTIGDFVLRQPMIAAMVEAGHELMLLVRRSVAPLARQVAPTAHVVEYPAEPYALSPEGPWEPFEPVFATAAQFGAALLVIAPYRWTLAEEKLAERLPAVPRVGMSGNLYRGDPYAGAAPASSMALDQVAQVHEDDLEIVKNEALGSLILGRPLRLPDPKLTPLDDAMDEARRLLASVGFAPGEYWTACVGGTAHVALKTWPAERWAGALSHWAGRYGRKFLFVGLPQEQPAVDAVRAGMDTTAVHNTAVLMHDGISLATLEALIALSQGYAGHDTGPMHVAAATGRPVLAVFGGGTWLRFLPAVEPSIAITMGAPCVGCGWVCTFPESYCIKSVPTDDVMRAIDDMEAGRIVGRQSRVIEPSPALMARFVRESAQAAEARLREAVEARKQVAALAEAAAIAAATAAEPPPAPPMEEPSPPPPPPPVEPTPTAAELIEQVSGPLRQQLVTLQQELASMRGELEGRLPLRPAPPAVAPRPVSRRPWRQVMVDLVVGKPHLCPKPPVPPLPVSLVIPVSNADVDAVRASIESALSQGYCNMEVVVVDDGRTPAVTEYLASLGSAVRVLSLPNAATFELVQHGFDQAYGQVLAFLRPGVTYMAGTISRVGDLFGRKRFVKAAYFETTLADGPWRHNIGPTRQIDTVDFFDDEPIVYDSIFWRRTAYNMVGRIKPVHGAAADWDLAVRTTRMFGIWRAGGAAAIVARQAPVAGRAEALADAKRNFMANFGTLGRARCDVIHRLNRLNETIENYWGPARPVFSMKSPAITDIATAPADSIPVCPLTKAPADGLLFSTFTDLGAIRVYYATPSATAVVHGPTPTRQADEPKRDLLDALSLVGGVHRDPRTLLDLSPGDGSVMDVFVRGGSDRRCVAVTKNVGRPSTAHTIIDGDPFDAPLVVPDGQTFDVIVLGRALQRTADPLALLRRARNLLHPNGVIVVTGDNLHARSMMTMGHAWLGWNLDVSRTIFSPIGLRRLAKAASLRVRKLRTLTHGESGNLFWDLRGQGDVIHAIVGE